MASTADIRNGLCVNYNHDIYTIIDFQHVKPGKGPAFVRTKLKSVTTGKVVENTWPSGHKIDPVRVERRTYQYSYKDSSGLQLMNTETWEQIALTEDQITNSDLLKEGDIVEVLVKADDEQVLTAELPATVVLKVTYTEPGVKGDTATNTLKPATLETGAEVNVPLFINEGEMIKIDTQNRAYMERAK